MAARCCCARSTNASSCLPRLAACFEDRRDPERIEHQVGELVSQRVYALALGYEDLNDHDELRRRGLVSARPCGSGRRRRRSESREHGRILALYRLFPLPFDLVDYRDSHTGDMDKLLDEVVGDPAAAGFALSMQFGNQRPTNRSFCHPVGRPSTVATTP